jgi:fibronectin type 3 domain-containing protein
MDMPVRRISGASLLLMVCGVLNACGGGGEPVPECDSTGPATVVLHWDAVTGADGYRIYVRTAPGSYLQNLEQGLDVGNATTFTATALAAGTTYHFAVTAYDSIGESDFSNEACQTIVN